MKIYILDQFVSSGVDFAAQHAEVVRWDDPRAKNWHEDADGLLVRTTPLTAEDFAKAKKLRVVAKQGVGVNLIDLAAAKAHGVIVCNTPGVNSEAVAEMGLALALAVTRRVAELDRRIRAGETVKRINFLGIELWEKTVGVIGMGNIGTRIARKYHGAFNMKVLAYDPYISDGRWSDIPHERVSSLDELLPRVDLLTIHVPLTAETRHLIGRRELALMKETAVLVNVSRGEIVDEEALYDALKAGRLFGAGLDVFKKEPPTTDNPLVGLPNVVATPHAAGGTRETQDKSSLVTAQQLIHVLGGGQPMNRVA
ncbi:MAG: hydroxyacid dehydrogenase [Deltaproteobacteria bacterium]|nr:hydroxyacid dehydrogenase [Deltaproteobacteria bacterium]MDA8125356.1 hydroxyacid dehydrogenase [Deltaproteobacteria bacterium]